MQFCRLSLEGSLFFCSLSFTTNQARWQQSVQCGGLFVCLPGAESHSCWCTRNVGFMPRPWEEVGESCANPLLTPGGTPHILYPTFCNWCPKTGDSDLDSTRVQRQTLKCSRIKGHQANEMTPTWRRQGCHGN